MSTSQRQGVVMRFVCWLLLALLCVGFKPSTHIHSGNVATVGSQFVLGDRSYPKDQSIVDAVSQYPDYYRAGVVGPDGFPDLLLGQSIIHPDLRCENTSGLAYAQCSDAAGHGFTYEWLGHVWERGWARYTALIDGSAMDQMAAKRILAFTTGYLTHAAGDMWAHTMVNHYAGGVFPAAAEMVTTAGARDIGIRHIVVEGFVGLRTPANSVKTLEAPLEFVRSTFIRNREPSVSHPCSTDVHRPTPLAQGSHFDQFLQTRKSLCTYVEDYRGVDVGDALLCFGSFGVGCLTEAVEELAVSYADHWVADIDEGLYEWPQFSENVAKALFTSDDIGAAATVVNEFALLHLAAMAGLPDAVGGGIFRLQEVGQALDAMFARTPGLRALQQKLEELKIGILNALFQQFFGVTYQEAVSYMSDPGRWIDSYNGLTSSPINPMVSTSGDLLDLMQVSGDTYSVAQFMAFRNATTTAELIMLKPATLDAMLRDLHVGKLYTGARLREQVSADPETPTSLELSSDLGSEMQKNVMLGYVRSIDANHGWARATIDYRTGQVARYGEGMPLWRDCLARTRAFPILFRDDRALDFSAVTDDCQLLAEPLPAIELVPVPPHPAIQGMEPSCFARRRYRIINHLDDARPYSLYYRVMPVTGSGPIFHRVVHRAGDEAVAARGETEETIGFSTCQPGGYKIEVFLFAKMVHLPAEHARNVHFEPPQATALQRHYFSVPIIDRDTFDATLQNPAQCVRTVACPPSSAPGGSTPGPGICVEQICPGGGPPIVTPASDADGDDVPDAVDNCEVNENADQANADGDRSGDVCDGPSVQQGLPRFDICSVDPTCLDRFRLALERLTRGTFRKPRGGKPCLTCPPEFAGIEPYVRHDLSLYDLGLLTAREFLTNVAALQDGPHVSGMSVVDARFEPEKNRIVYGFAPGASGKVTLELPRSIVKLRRQAGKSQVSLQLDGRSLQSDAVVLGAQIRTQITVPVGAKSLVVHLKVPR